MSDENLWGDDQSFVDMPDEAKLDSNGNLMQSPPAQLPRSTAPTQRAAPVQPTVVSEPEPEYTEEVEEAVEDEDYSAVLTDAHLRLEQGSLYKLIMNHNLFDGIDADPKAVQNVQREIKRFARERMEIMLGMRKETSTVEHLEIDFPFNSLEVDTLKALARAATKGATDNSDNFVPSVTRTTQEVDNIPRKRSLNTIGGSTAPKKSSAQPKRPLQSKASTPVKRSKLDLTIDQIAREEGIPRELLEENIPGVGGKPVNQMTEQEILDRNRLVASRRKTQVKSTGGIPMPTLEQEEALAVARASQMEASPLMAKIIDAAKKMPIKQ